MSKSLIQDDNKSEIVLTSNLSADFLQLLESEQHSDVVFLVGDERIHAHKLILAARSDYFRAMLFGGLSESTSSEIKIEASVFAFKIILKYIYTGRINLRTIQTSGKMDLIIDTLGLSNLYGFLELKEAIANYLKSSLTITNVCNILDASRLYELDSLSQICFTFIDKYAAKLLQEDSFNLLSLSTLVILLTRDSFFCPEIDIFQAVKRWIESNSEVTPEAIRTIVAEVRLPLISLQDLLTIVRPTGLMDAEKLLDAIHVKTQSKVNRLPHRGRVCPEENIATLKHGARVIQGMCDEANFSILDDTRGTSNLPYDMEKGYTRHAINNSEDNGIIIELSDIFIINFIKILLWDLDNRSYSYIVEVSVEKTMWDVVIDYSLYHCRSWQYLYFPKRPVKFIRITGTHNTINRVFHLVSLEASLLQNIPETSNGLVVPKLNVASVDKSAIVLEGVSRNKNSLLNGNVSAYDWDNGYTCHQLGSGNILVQLGQPYMIGSMRILLWDCDDRSYSFFIETSINAANWDVVVDKKNKRLKSWQSFTFESRPVSYIRITGTYNSANEIFHIVHFECPNQSQIQEEK